MKNLDLFYVTGYNKTQKILPQIFSLLEGSQMTNLSEMFISVKLGY